QSENQSAPAISGFQRFAVFGLFFAPLREILESLTDPLQKFSFRMWLSSTLCNEEGERASLMTCPDGCDRDRAAPTRTRNRPVSPSSVSAQARNTSRRS